MQGTAHLKRKGKERTPSKDDTPIASQQSKTTEPVHHAVQRFFRSLSNSP